MSNNLKVGELIQRQKGDHYLSIEKAVKFFVPDCGTLISSEVRDYAYLLIESGLCHAPYENCWFELQIKNSETHSIAEVRFGFHLIVIDKPTPDEEDDFVPQVIISGYWMHPGRPWEPIPALACWDTSTPPQGFVNTLKVSSFDEKDCKTETQKNLVRNVPEDFFEGLFLQAACVVALLDIRDVVKESVDFDERINRRRRLMKRPQLYSHKILRIPFSYKAQVSQRSGKILERRAHWRRGHLRHLPSQRVVPVAPCLVRGNGFVTKDYTFGGRP